MTERKTRPAGFVTLVIQAVCKAALRGLLSRPGVSGGFALVLAGVFLCLAQPASGQGTEIQVITEEFPPYDFAGEAGRVEGLSTEVVREVLASLDLEVEIEIFPWARAIKMAKEKPNVLLFSVVRTQEREAQFHWVGVVCEVKSYLYRLRSRDDIEAEKLSDLRDFTIGVVRGWAGQKYLEENGFRHLQKVAESDRNIRKLITGRVDLIEDYEANIIFRMKRLGLDPNLLRKVYFNADISGPLYAVFSKSTREGVVERFKGAFSGVHLDGRYDSIQNKWRALD